MAETQNRSLAGLAMLAVLIASSAVSGSEIERGSESAIVQLTADVTLIDSECRTLNATFGSIFQYAEAHGVHWVELMPGGRRRDEFDAAVARRLKTTSHEDLCGSLARQYGEQFPDLFTQR